MKIAITGHRPSKLGNDYDLTSPLVKWIKFKIENHVADLLYRRKSKEDVFITGMALGIDQLLVQIGIEMNIPFIAAVPFKGQSLVWPQKSQIRYGELLQQAKFIYVVDEGKAMDYTAYLRLPFTHMSTYEASKSLNKRNEWMIDQLAPDEDRLIAVWDGTPGGTKNCIDYAKKQLSPTDIIYIDPKQFIKPL